MRIKWRPLALVVWGILFVSIAVAVFGLKAFGSLGFNSFFHGVRETPYLWLSLLQSVGQVLLLLGSLYVTHSWRFISKRVSFIDFTLMVWPSLCGLWLTLKRFAFSSFGVDGLMVVEPLLVSVFFSISLTGCGLLVSRVLGFITPDEANPLKKFLIANLLGIVVVSIVLFLAALLGFWEPIHLWFLLGAFLILALFGLFPERASSVSGETPPSKEVRSWLRDPSFYAWGLVLVLLFGVFQLGWLPPDDSDELRYHLTLPKRYLEAGQFVVLPDQLFSFFPTGMEMLMGLPLSLDWLRPEELRQGLIGGGKFIHAYMAYLCVILLVVWHRDLGDSEESPSLDSLPPLLFLSIPFVPILASWAFVDFGSALGWLGSAYFGWRFFYRTGSIHDAAMAGVALGWSLMVKYTGLAWCVIFGVAWIFLSAIRKKSPASLIPIVVIPAVLSAPWLLNNWIRTGNPFAPLLSGMFGFGFDPVQKAFYDWHAGMKGDLNGFRHLSFGAKAVDLVLLPFRAALQPERVENNPIGGLIPLLLPAFIMGIWKRKKGMAWIAILSLGCFLLWALTYRDPRFAIPLWGLYLLIGSLGLKKTMGSISESHRPTFSWVAIALILMLSVNQSEELFRRLYAFGPAIDCRIDPEDYLAQRLPSMRAVREVERRREEEPIKPTLLLLGQEQSYYFDSPVRGTDYFDGPFLAGVAKEASDVVAISQRLKGEGIDWVFINRETLEAHPANRLRGLWFTTNSEEAVHSIEQVSAGQQPDLDLEKADEIPAFRRMHAWLIRHPGYKEVSLQTGQQQNRPLVEEYRDWLTWPEMRGVTVADLPRSRYSLLVGDPEWRSSDDSRKGDEE
ncbi:MAG: hypothetical protein H6752_03495 [Candidatus Omnitrophica bacterium]|nr:hypothetical protein [Candidatus Omnitrophota bacterium]